MEPDTTDLRAGAPIHDSLLALLPLVGVWRGAGTGVSPGGHAPIAGGTPIASAGAEFAYGQQVTFAHDGRPFLSYEARAWLVDPSSGDVIRQAWRETGFWRAGATEDDFEVVLASNTGQAMQYVGVAGDLRWELTSTSLVPAATAKPVDAERRLYAILNSAGGPELVYAAELAPAGRPLATHLHARLSPA